MNSAPAQSNFILIRRLPDGRIEWIPVEAPPQHVPAAPDAAYTLIDRVNYEAPQSLVAERLGEDLVVKVQGTQVLVLGGFFTAADVAFYPTTNISGGAGPFSGSPLTAESVVPPSSTSGDQVASADGDDEPEGEGASASSGGTSSAGARA